MYSSWLNNIKEAAVSKAADAAKFVQQVNENRKKKAEDDDSEYYDEEDDSGEQTGAKGDQEVSIPVGRNNGKGAQGISK